MHNKISSIAKVSIIIPVYNPGHVERECLRSVTCQNYFENNYEIIVIDDGSDADIGRFFADFPVKILKQLHRGPAAARNTGIKHSRGDIIVFLDSDCIVDKDWIMSHVQAHQDHSARGINVGCIGGAIGPYLKDINFIEVCDYYSSWYLPPRSFNNRNEYEYLPTTNLSMRRDVVNRIGGFDDSLWCGEDSALGMELREFGYSIVKIPEINCYHKGRRTLKGYFRHHYHWGRFAPHFRRYGSKARYSFLFPPNIILAILFFPIISVGYTCYVIGKWFFQNPFLILAISPMIFMSKIAYACGCIMGTMNLINQKK